jgi:hypothetical protein
LLLSFKKEDSSFSEEKEAKRLLLSKSAAVNIPAHEAAGR